MENFMDLLCHWPQLPQGKEGALVDLSRCGLRKKTWATESGGGNRSCVDTTSREKLEKRRLHKK